MEYTRTQKVQQAAVSALFSFKPLFRLAASNARAMMVKRGEAMGIPWAKHLEELDKVDWDIEVDKFASSSPGLEYPEYYLSPFHAYESGNMCIEAALEAEVASLTVHAPVFNPKTNALDKGGDAMLRARYHAAARPLLKGRAASPQDVLDVGCSVGLSTDALRAEFPRASITGLDLSPYFLAVASHRNQDANVRFVHAAAERTGLASDSFDLVSMCLVCHELPRAATEAIVAECHRLLRPGGALSIMEMNPRSPFLRKLVGNVPAFTAFRATEPFIEDYLTFDIERAIGERGFEMPKQTECSPRHRVLVAHKQGH